MHNWKAQVWVEYIPCSWNFPCWGGGGGRGEKAKHDFGCPLPHTPHALPQPSLQPVWVCQKNVGYQTRECWSTHHRPYQPSCGYWPTTIPQKSLTWIGGSGSYKRRSPSPSRSYTNPTIPLLVMAPGLDQPRMSAREAAAINVAAVTRGYSVKPRLQYQTVSAVSGQASVPPCQPAFSLTFRTAYHPRQCQSKDIRTLHSG
jgi:hypothetical protein